VSPAEVAATRADHDSISEQLSQLRRAADELAALTDRMLSDAADLAKRLDRLERALSDKQ
jgi:uncharacterized coiled-coil DUF342 family protein